MHISVDVPELKQFVCGEFSSIEKFKFLAFITGIDVDTLKAIPNDYLMHVIIMLNLVQNKSLKVFEALAFTKALKDVCDQRLPFTIICPETVNIRAFRTSYLYTTMHYNLTCCLATIGLKDFIVSKLHHINYIVISVIITLLNIYNFRLEL